MQGCPSLVSEAFAEKSPLAIFCISLCPCHVEVITVVFTTGNRLMEPSVLVILGS